MNDSADQPSPVNPYAPVLASDDTMMVTDAVLTRHKYLNHEVSVQGVGSLFILAAVVLGVALVPPLFVGQGFGALPAFTIAVIALIPVYLMTGVGLRRLQPWSRIAASVFAVIGLMGIPVGTLISIYVLYLMLSQKGQMVFSSEYAAIRAATPEVKYQSSRWILVLALICAAMVAFAFVAVLVSH